MAHIEQYRITTALLRITIQAGCIMGLTINQQIFMRDAKTCDLDIDEAYLGKLPFDNLCPAVYVENFRDLITDAVVCVVKAGDGFVVYTAF